MKKQIQSFSIVELMIMLIALTVITAIATPLITKKFSEEKLILAGNTTTTQCQNIDPDCTFCQKKMFGAICLNCAKICPPNEIKKTKDCKCYTCNNLYGAFCANCDERNCTKCKSGYYLKDGICTICPAGSMCSNGHDSTLCPNGYYQNEEGQTTCKKCPDGSQSGEGAIGCESCNAGFTQSQTGHGCIPCPKGCSCPDGRAHACEAGYYQDQDGQATCKACNAGYYQNKTGQTSCICCPAGTEGKNPSSIECTPCKDGYYAEQNTCLASCKANTAVGCYTKSKTSNTCVTCQANYWFSAGLCKPCPADTHTDPNNTSHGCSPNKAKNCASKNPIEDRCDSCLAGYGYANVTGECIECADGYYAPANNKSPCRQNTAPGCYKRSKTENKCLTCTSGNGHNYDCTQPCQFGEYNDGTMLFCSALSDTLGCATTSKTQDKCLTCSQGYGLNGNFCSKCSAGKYSTSGATTCLNCPDMQYQDKPGQHSCKACSDTCASCDKVTGKCLSCIPNYELDPTTGTCEGKCVVPNCHQCAKDTNSKIIPTYCWECNKGYRVEQITYGDKRNCLPESQNVSCTAWNIGPCETCFFGCATDIGIHVMQNQGTSCSDGTTIYAPSCTQCKPNYKLTPLRNSLGILMYGCSP